MASNILSIGQSAILAAQVGLNTTGHNIANAATPGYTRQVVVQSAAQAQNAGFGFVGSGTEIASVKRIFNEFLNNQVLSSQTAKSELDSSFTQIKQIDNLLADSTSGLSPAIQDFFNGVQDLSANPDSVASRQAVLSAADTLAARFQSIDGRLGEIRNGVNSQITSSITVINSFAQQIAKLNDEISTLGAFESKPPNDLLDQRDQLVADLNKEVKATVIKQSDNTYTVAIGNGQPLVVGPRSFSLAATASPTDLTRIEVGYVTNGKTVLIADSALPGGQLGGLLNFRSNTLDVSQNSLGRAAVGLASTFNAQHRLGQDQNGALGGDFFNAAAPVVSGSGANTGNAVVSATISNAGLLTTSDYQLQFDGTNFNVIRLEDNVSVYSNPAFPSAPTTIDGLDISNNGGTFNAGDNFLIQPTIKGAAGFGVAITDRTKIAAAAPIRTAAALTNPGSGKISGGTVVDATLLTGHNYEVDFSVVAGVSTFSVFDLTNDPGKAAPLPASGAYVPSQTIAVDGFQFDISGTPVNGDSFTIGPNIAGVGDNRNAVLLGKLQGTNTLANNKTTYQGAYAQLVSFIGNKTRELQVTSAAAGSLLTQATQAQQAESGVNLDEEAANLVRYQQAYQAAGKVMQIASQLFDALLSIGR